MDGKFLSFVNIGPKVRLGRCFVYFCWFCLLALQELDASASALSEQFHSVIITQFVNNLIVNS